MTHGAAAASCCSLLKHGGEAICRTPALQLCRCVALTFKPAAATLSAQQPLCMLRTASVALLTPHSCLY